MNKLVASFRQVLKNLRTPVLLVIAIFFIYSSNSFAQWVQVSGSPTGYIYEIVESNGVLYIGTSGNGVYKSTDNMSTWQQISQGLDTPEAKIVYELLIEEDTLYAATRNGIYKSIDDGTNWVKMSNGIPIVNGSLYEDTKSIFKQNGVFFTGAFAGIYRSVDDSENWIATNITGSHVGCDEFINHDGTLFAARENINTPYGYKSTDDGLNWDFLTSISVPTITFFSEPGKLWAGTIHGVWLSEDDGSSWENRSNGLTLDPYNSSIIRVDGNLMTSVKFGGSGVFRSFDEGLNWEDFSQGLPFLSIIAELYLFGDKVIAATSDGLWERSVTVGLQDEESRPAREFTLHQNYPNPFNPATSIRYYLPVSGKVSLKIYNSHGKDIRSLVNEKQSPGEKTIAWDGKDQSGRHVNPGIYFYYLITDKYSSGRKMLLLR